MLENATAPSDIWRVQEYLYEQRKTVDRIYRYSYSGLILISSILMRDGWLTEADLVGLQQEKITGSSSSRGFRRSLAEGHLGTTRDESLLAIADLAISQIPIILTV
jgi:hypothetical protein